jgi:YGGT family protein
MLGTIVYFLFGIAEALLALRIVFRLLGANAASGFVSWIYSFSQPLVTPFSGIFNQPAATVVGPGAVSTSVIDWAAIVALIIIGVIGAVIGRMIYHPRHAGV